MSVYINAVGGWAAFAMATVFCAGIVTAFTGFVVCVVYGGLRALWEGVR